MDLDADAAYRALTARDARFDGRLFVGVTSTGIYCRPVCRVRTPRRENCRFFSTAAQAEAQRFRPCLKCRPEIAPGLSLMDSPHTLAQAAAQTLDAAVLRGETPSLAQVAARLGVTERHLRRIFTATHGVSPREHLATRRLLLAKQLLTDTTQPVAQVALASGFGSVRRFNAAFAERYRLVPGALRRGAQAAGVADAVNALRLAWRPPLDADALLGFWARRTLRGLEHIDTGALRLRRVLTLPHEGRPLRGWMAATLHPARCEVRVQLDPVLLPATAAVLQRVRQAMDLDANPGASDAVQALLPLPPRPGLRLPGVWDPFEGAARVVLGQQVTVAAARTLLQRLLDTLGTPVTTPWPAQAPGGWRAFPDAATVADAPAETLGRLGIVRQRVRALQALARAMADGALVLERGMPPAPTLQALLALPGIGPWTAEVIALRVLAWPDAWPTADVGLMRALGTRDREELQRRAEPWRPWRSHALMRLWLHVETGT
jgi:AraC family transcriptional regulator, regulatory protein of adaptative response / DNA-3-methyladenine glycosylase II